jgi:hypothetical protein
MVALEEIHAYGKDMLASSREAGTRQERGVTHKRGAWMWRNLRLSGEDATASLSYATPPFPQQSSSAGTASTFVVVA